MPADPPYQYDAFISYSHHDEQWVQGWLLPNLEKAGIKVCIDFRDFEPGAPSLGEMERAVLTSRKTLLVLTPDYIQSQWAEFENLLVQTLDPAARQRRLLPLMVNSCELPLRIRTLTYLDFTRPDRTQFQFDRLVKAIRVDATPVSVPPPPQPAASSSGGTGIDIRGDHITIIGDVVGRDKRESRTQALSEEATRAPAADGSPTQLREVLVQRFSLEDLKTLCFDLDVDYDSLPGEGKAGKARELVAHMQRHNRLPDLIAKINQAVSK